MPLVNDGRCPICNGAGVTGYALPSGRLVREACPHCRAVGIDATQTLTIIKAAQREAWNEGFRNGTLYAEKVRSRQRLPGGAPMSPEAIRLATNPHDEEAG